MSSDRSNSDSSRLNIMAAAVEHMRSADLDEQSNSSASPSRRVKLVLPTLTPAMQQDLALSKTEPGKNAKPLSIGNRAEYTDYPLKEIMSPHANDVCKCLNACSLSCIAPTKAHQSYMHSNTSLSSLSDESQYAAVEADLTTIQATNPSASSLTKLSSPTSTAPSARSPSSPAASSRPCAIRPRRAGSYPRTPSPAYGMILVMARHARRPPRRYGRVHPSFEI